MGYGDRHREVVSEQEMNKAMLLTLRDRGQGGFNQLHPEMIDRTMGGFLDNVGFDVCDRASNVLDSREIARGMCKLDMNPQSGQGKIDLSVHGHFLFARYLDSIWGEPMNRDLMYQYLWEMKCKDPDIYNKWIEFHISNGVNMVEYSNIYGDKN